MSEKWRPRRARRLGVAAGFLLIATAWSAVGGGQAAFAFDHRWSVLPHGSNTPNCAIWDDSPGAGVNNESGFFWVRNSQLVDERCTFGSGFAGISSSTFNLLRVRVATNDSARFEARVRNAGNVVVATAVVMGAGAHSGFLNLAVNIPPGHLLTSVELMLEDDPNNPVPSTRSSVLIDFVGIFNSANGAAGWVESFSSAA